MLKIRKMLLGIFIIGLLASVDKGSVLAAEKSSNISVAVLIDTSQSIRDGQQIKEILWAQDFCSKCLDTGIRVSFYTFDDQQEAGKLAINVILEETVITEQNIVRNMNALDKIEHTGRYTDLYGAMRDAVSFLNSGKAEQQYIILLSDGRLDYDNQDESDVKGTEAEARKKFCNITKVFTENAGKVFLVEFDNKNLEQKDKLWKDLKEERFKKNINLFREIEEYKGISSFKADAFEEVSERIFNDAGFPVSREKMQKVDNNIIQFNLKEYYDCAIINVVRTGSYRKDELRDSDFIVKYKDQLRPANLIAILPNSAFIFLQGSDEGEYEIILPDAGSWEYKISKLDRSALGKIRISVITSNEAGVEAEKHDDTYIINNGDIILYTELKGEISDFSGIRMSYQWAREGEEFGNDIWFNCDIADSMKQTIRVPEKGVYQILVKGSYDQSKIVYSNIVKVDFTPNNNNEAIESAQESERVISGSTADKWDLKKIGDFSEDEVWQFALDEKKYKIEAVIDNDSFVLKDATISFEDERDYTLTFYDKKGKELGRIRFEITEKKKKIFEIMKILKKWLSRN